jgi:hypothetical protein
VCDAFLNAENVVEISIVLIAPYEAIVLEMD